MTRYQHIRRYLFDINTIGMTKDAESLRFDPLDLGEEYATRNRVPCTQDNTVAEVLDELCRHVDLAIAEIARLEQSAEEDTAGMTPSHAQEQTA